MKNQEIVITILGNVKMEKDEEVPTLAQNPMKSENEIKKERDIENEMMAQVFGRNIYLPDEDEPVDSSAFSDHEPPKAPAKRPTQNEPPKKFSQNEPLWRAAKNEQPPKRNNKLKKAHIKIFAQFIQNTYLRRNVLEIEQDVLQQRALTAHPELAESFLNHISCYMSQNDGVMKKAGHKKCK